MTDTRKKHRTVRSDDVATDVTRGTRISVTSGLSGRAIGTTSSEVDVDPLALRQTGPPLTGPEIVVTSESGQASESPRSKVARRVIGYVSKSD